MIVSVHDSLVRVTLGETLCIGLTVDVVLCASVLSEVRALKKSHQQPRDLQQKNVPRGSGFRPWNRYQ